MSIEQNGYATEPGPEAGTTVSPENSTTATELPSNGRPACLHSTIQELLFILTATMAVSMTSFLAGLTMVITSSIGDDLHMNSAEITWISASSS
jgi:hypothetical protein